MRIPIAPLAALLLSVACGKAPPPKDAAAPAPTAGRQLLLTYFTMPG